MSSNKTSAVLAEKNTEKGRGKKYIAWWFLAGVILLYMSLYFFATEFVSASLLHFYDLLVSIVPILIMVFIILWLLNLNKGMQDKLIQLADKNSGLKGWLVAITGGILSHGPIYAWYPLLQKLQKQGVRPALLATFLYARSIKIPFLPLMVHYFGMGYTVMVTIYIALFSIAHGWLVEKVMLRDNKSGLISDE
ncbi:hypothetical protein MNBD_GAMMA09-3649 [hydrothermal vent metagenome]|uniref:Permease n=1 Tax=hydrothermal vent metagenome TaxID=652676 RepID=A0A3B0X0U9_9ZZZZ